jgi:hypothetical protein
MTVKQSSLVVSTTPSADGATHVNYKVLNISNMSTVAFSPHSVSGLQLTLRPESGERFAVSNGTYRLGVSLALAEAGADLSRTGIAASNAYVKVELVDLISPAPLDSDWFLSESRTSVSRDINGKWILLIRGRSKLLTASTSFSALVISCTYVLDSSNNSTSNSTLRRMALEPPVTFHMPPLSTVSFDYKIGCVQSFLELGSFSCRLSSPNKFPSSSSFRYCWFPPLCFIVHIGHRRGRWRVECGSWM